MSFAGCSTGIEEYHEMWHLFTLVISSCYVMRHPSILKQWTLEIQETYPGFQSLVYDIFVHKLSTQWHFGHMVFRKFSGIKSIPAVMYSFVFSTYLYTAVNSIHSLYIILKGQQNVHPTSTNPRTSNATRWSWVSWDNQHMHILTSYECSLYWHLPKTDKSEASYSWRSPLEIHDKILE